MSGQDGRVGDQAAVALIRSLSGLQRHLLASQVVFSRKRQVDKCHCHNCRCHSCHCRLGMVKGECFLEVKLDRE